MALTCTVYHSFYRYTLHVCTCINQVSSWKLLSLILYLIIIHCHFYINATDVLKDEKRPEACTVTRWNSQLKMIRSALTIPDRKLAEIDGAPRLTAHKKTVLRASRYLVHLKKPLIVLNWNTFHQLDMCCLVFEDYDTNCNAWHLNTIQDLSEL